MKRVLIITYYWPPSGGSGVQRWLKMSKYLPEYGWQPVIYTAEGAEYPVEDPSLEKDVSPEAEVIRRPIVEPYSFYKKFLGMKKEQKVKAGFIDETGKKKGWKERLSIWVRGNFFIPDARRWWVKPSVRYLKQYLNDHPVDAIISTGPPQSMHLIAMKLKEALGIPWIADFRDPWTDIEYYSDLMLTHRADRKHHRLEKAVLTQADRVVTVSPHWAHDLESHGGNKVAVIYNGFDENDIPSTKRATNSSSFIINYIGVLTSVRNPQALWQALGELVNEDPAFGQSLRIDLVGHTDDSVRQYIRQQGLEQRVQFKGYIPHHQVAECNRNASLLLLTLNAETKPMAKGLIPAKLFEYMASGRPILCIGSKEGDTARILKETNAGVTVGFEEKDQIKEAVKTYYQRFLTDGLPGNEITTLGKYSRKSLAEEYVNLLEKTLTDHEQ